MLLFSLQQKVLMKDIRMTHTILAILKNFTALVFLTEKNILINDNQAKHTGNFRDFEELC